MRRIPKNAFFYWGGEVLPFLRYMSIRWFKNLNPDWKVFLFLPKHLTPEQTWDTHENKVPLDTEDYMPRLQADGDINLFTFDMEPLGFSNSLPEVIKSDIIRAYLLYSLGGLWSDCDCVNFRPLRHTFSFNEEFDAMFCYRRGGPTQDDTPKNGPLYHSIGFLAGVRGNQWFKKIFSGMGKRLDGGQYQTVGSPYYKEVVDMDDRRLFNLDINVAYPSRALPGMWQGASQEYMNQIQPCTISWHWYGGFPLSGQMQNDVTQRTYRDYDNIVCRLITILESGGKVI